MLSPETLKTFVEWASKPVSPTAVARVSQRVRVHFDAPISKEVGQTVHDPYEGNLEYYPGMSNRRV